MTCSGCFLRLKPDSWCAECVEVARDNQLRAMRLIEVVEADPFIFSAETRASVEMMQECKSRIRIPLARRPGNALNVEIGQPADRCIQKRPHHWPNSMTAIRWLASGGEALVFGCCCPPCPLDSWSKDSAPVDGDGERS
jgi:hypothetical protein